MPRDGAQSFSVLHRGPAVGQGYLCLTGPCAILLGLCMMTGAGCPLPQDIQKRSRWHLGTQVLLSAPQLSCEVAEEAALRARVEGQGHQASRLSSSGLPVRNSEEVFLLDPLLSPGQRVPLYLPKPPQQVRMSPPTFSLPFSIQSQWDKLPFPSSQAMGSLKLSLPPPIMSSSVQPSSSQGCPFSSQPRPPTWLSEAEMIALAGLLQMSQGEQPPDSQASSLPSASCPDPAYVSEDPGPNGGQSCSGSTDPRPTQNPDNHRP